MTLTGQDAKGVELLKGAIARALKDNHNRHHFAAAQL